MLTLRLPDEGGAPSQFESFLESLLNYAGNSIGQKCAGPWITQYIKSKDSNWHPDSLLTDPRPTRPRQASYMISDGNNGQVL